MRTILTTAALCASLFALASCESTKPLYHWDTFNESTYNLLRNPDQADLVAEIRALSGEMERDSLEGRRAPPGAHAHLGYLYFLSGNPQSAKLEFEAEKELYPESTVFIDGVLRRLQS